MKAPDVFSKPSGLFFFDGDMTRCALSLATRLDSSPLGRDPL